jgi:hypothetical protein
LAPDGLDRRLNPVAAPCVPSITGAAQVTVRLLPVPCASAAAADVFGGYPVAAGVAGRCGVPARP